MASALCLALVMGTTAFAVPGPGTWEVYDAGAVPVPITASLTADIDNCPAGGKVLIGSGTFSVAGLDTDAKEIRGSGKYITVLQSATNVQWTSFTALSIVADLSLDGVELRPFFSPGITVDSVEIKNANRGVVLPAQAGGNSVISNCHIHDINANGVQAWGSGTITVSNCIFENTGLVPQARPDLYAAIAAGGTDFSVIDTDIIGSAVSGPGIFAENSGSSFSIEGGSIKDVLGSSVGGDEYGAVTVRPRGSNKPAALDINGTEISGTRDGAAIWVICQSATECGNASLSVTNSVIRDNDGAGIHTRTSGDVDVVNNTFFGNGTTVWFGEWEILVDTFCSFECDTAIQNIVNNIVEIGHNDPGSTTHVPRHRFCHGTGFSSTENCNNNLELTGVNAGAIGTVSEPAEFLLPAPGGAAHNTGDPAFAAIAGATDYAGDLRECGIIDIGANELISPCPSADAILDEICDTMTAQPPTSLDEICELVNQLIDAAVTAAAPCDPVACKAAILGATPFSCP